MENTALQSTPAPATYIPPASALSIFFDTTLFEQAKRAALVLSESTMVPQHYRGEVNLGNCMIAMDISARLGINPLMVMQNLYVVLGIPSWSGQMVLALVNKSGVLTDPLEYEFKGTRGQDDWGCRCIGKMKGTGKKVEGPWVDIAMAKAEGWYDRKDKDGRVMVTKWKTIPELMMRYRAASYFGRTTCPDVLLGLTTKEEAEDMGQQIPVGGVTIPINAVPSLGEATKEPEKQPEKKPVFVEAGATEVAKDPDGPTAEEVKPTAPRPRGRPPKQRAAVVEPPPSAPIHEPESKSVPQVMEDMPTEPEPEAGVQVPLLDALLEFLDSNKVDVFDFLDWCHSTGRDVGICDTSTIKADTDIPDALIKKVLSDTTGLTKCIRIYGKPAAAAAPTA